MSAPQFTPTKRDMGPFILLFRKVKGGKRRRFSLNITPDYTLNMQCDVLPESRNHAVRPKGVDFYRKSTFDMVPFDIV
jgi:hypothetical protein